MSKHLRAFRAGANILAFNKNNTNYAMTCAWAMMVDYQKIAMLIGSQSVTGQNLEIGQKVGVSALSDGQQEIAKIIGMNHSNEINKFDTIPFIWYNTCKSRYYTDFIAIFLPGFAGNRKIWLYDIISRALYDIIVWSDMYGTTLPNLRKSFNQTRIAILKNTNTKSSRLIIKVLNSAVANATNNFNMKFEDLVISECFINPGPVLKRSKIGSRSKVDRRDKRTSHITVKVSDNKEAK